MDDLDPQVVLLGKLFVSLNRVGIDGSQNIPSGRNVHGSLDDHMMDNKFHAKILLQRRCHCRNRLYPRLKGDEDDMVGFVELVMSVGAFDIEMKRDNLILLALRHRAIS